MSYMNKRDWIGETRVRPVRDIYRNSMQNLRLPRDPHIRRINHIRRGRIQQPMRQPHLRRNYSLSRGRYPRGIFSFL